MSTNQTETLDISSYSTDAGGGCGSISASSNQMDVMLIDTMIRTMC